MCLLDKDNFLIKLFGNNILLYSNASQYSEITGILAQYELNKSKFEVSHKDTMS